MKTPRTFLIGAGLALALSLAGIPIPVQAQANAANPVATPAVAATATSPTTAPADDIRDIRGPRAIPSEELWFLWIAGGLALAAAAYGAWRWYRHVRTAPRLPHEIALDRLEKARALMTIETAREFSIEVSEIVRSYIEARFQVRAAHQTTEEFLHDLLAPSHALLAGHRQLLGDFLHHCDLAKFARWVLSREEMEEMHGSARTFVVETGKAPATTPASPLPQNQPAHA
jgi:hypothetical protein